MKKLLIGLIILLFSSNAYAEMLPEIPGLDRAFSVEEEDGSPSIIDCTRLKVTNASLTDNADGTASLAVIPAEVDTLDTVCDRGATTDQSITVGGVTDGTASLTGGSLTSVKLGTLTSNGFVKTGSGDGTLSVDTNTYLTTANAATTYLALDCSNDPLTANLDLTDNTLSYNIGGTPVLRIPATGKTYGGLYAGRYLTGQQNTCFGDQAGEGVNGSSTGAYNTAIGYQSLTGVTTGQKNTAIGRASLLSLTDGTDNVGIGANTLYRTTSGIANMALGSETLYNNTGNFNTGLGYASLKGVNGQSTGANNTAAGANSLFALTTGAGNCALGDNALVALTTGPGNVAVGRQAGDTITTGDYNTLLGYGTDAGANTNYSVAIGALTVTSVDNTCLIGNATQNLNTTITGTLDVTALVTAQTDLKVNQHAYFDAEFDNGNSGATDTIDWGVGNKQKSTLSESCTFTFTAPDGVGNFLLKCINFGAFTPTWPGTVKWPGGTEPSWTASGTDIATFYWDGVSYYAAANLDFS